ncbi:AMP-binding protein [soil metagenome]
MTLEDLPLILGGLFAAYLVLTWAFFPGAIRVIWWIWLHGTYRFRVYHHDRVPATGAVLLVCNHISYLDWMAIWIAVPRRVKFVLWSGYYQNWFLKLPLLLMRDRSIRIDNRSTNPHATTEALTAVMDALNAGEAVMIFPEGRLSRNGQMRSFGRGLELILRRIKVPVTVVPTCTSGFWGSFWSHKGGRIMQKWPTDFRRRVSLWFGIPIQGKVTAPELRAAVVESMADLAIVESDNLLLVPRWYLHTSAKWKNMFRTGFVDVSTGTERKLTIGQGFVAAWCLRNWLQSRLPKPDSSLNAVGLWLPTGLGSTLANIALAFLRRPTVNLNYTAGPDAVLSACKQTGIRTVITAKRFEAKMPLALPSDVERLYLEEALSSITKFAKVTRFLALLLLPAWFLERLLGTHRLNPDDLLTIVFSSGSTGEPKGVMLTQRNIAANAHAFNEGVDLHREDVMLATLPFFHSFGYTVCLWAPIDVGMTAVFHPDPRAAQEIGELARKYACTIQLGTATFLRFYLRRCQPGDFATMRLLICGAEKLPVKLQEQFHAKFGIQTLEGYGCTELSPVASVNLHDVDIKGVRQIANRLGTVGQPIPGVVVKAFDPESLAPLPPGEEGVLCVKGPNVMLGYLHQPEKTATVIHDGWYNTGDRGLIEPDGFIRITGRLSRFAKIAGEMVPLEKLDDELQDLDGTNERRMTVCAVPDEKRGERLIVLHLPDVEPKLTELLNQLSTRGVPNLWIPDRRDCYKVDAFPTLGSGKLDLKGLNDLAQRMTTKD